MNIERDNLAKALSEIARGSLRTKVARLREIFDEVEAARTAGASNKTIVDALKKHGLIFDVNNFKNARSRILKERAMQTLAQAAQTAFDAADQAVSSATTAIAINAGKTSIKAKPPATPTLPRKQKVQKESTTAEPKPAGSSRPSILSNSKGIFGELNPGPVDGTVDLHQTKGD